MPPVDRNKPVRAESSESRYSLMEFMREYPDDAACLQALWRKRYSPDGERAHCPKCETERVFKRYDMTQQRQSWTCTGCGHYLHPTAGTIFHKSSTSLHLWFYAMYLMASTRCGISAKQLERELGVTYKTAWRMASLIRKQLMADDGVPMSGPVEADESYFGGKRHGVIGRGVDKTPVFGIAQRQGRVMAVTERIYVSGDIHTNTIEGFWSLVKRGIGAVYHAVSAKHLQGYLNEYVWRYNRRNDGCDLFEALLLRAARP